MLVSVKRFTRLSVAGVMKTNEAYLAGRSCLQSSLAGEVPADRSRTPEERGRRAV